jgi:hypothetical protein
VKRCYLGREPFWTSLLPPLDVRVTRTLEELDDAVSYFRDRDVAVIAGLGGDGTLHHLLDSIVRHYGDTSLPLVLALAGGTMNGLARALGSGDAPDHVLAASLALLDSGRLPIQEHRLLKVEDASRGTLHGFTFATGLVFRAFEEYYRNPEPGIRDAVRAAASIRAAWFGAASVTLTLEVTADDAAWMPGVPHTMIASVLEQPLLWFRPFGTVADPAPGLNIAATTMRPREIAPRIWPIFRGRCRHPALRIGRSTTLTVRGECGYLIDGDLYGPGPTDVRISLGPRTCFLRP